uniref:Uncharacterized protein n=1 Tax=Anopheles dirus TaxID=7168 RepID=A0A182NX76_9DIPT
MKTKSPTSSALWSCEPMETYSTSVNIQSVNGPTEIDDRAVVRLMLLLGGAAKGSGLV